MKIHPASTDVSGPNDGAERGIEAIVDGETCGVTG
jgi:hypothetical protein